MDKKSNSIIKVCSYLVIVCLCVTLSHSREVSAASPKLNTKRLSYFVGQSKTIRIRNFKKISKTVWSCNKKNNVKLTNKKKNSVRVTAKKAGTVTIYARMKINSKVKELSCKVIIKSKTIVSDDEVASVSPVITPTMQPNSVVTVTAEPTLAPVSGETAKPDVMPSSTPEMNSTPTVAPTPTPTSSPTPTPTIRPTATPTIAPTSKPTATPSVSSANGTWAYVETDPDITILKALGDIFGYVGTSLSYDYNGLAQMQDSSTMSFVKNNYNSFTLENEMKPSAILSYSWWPNAGIRTCTKTEAQAAGMTIPSGYTESTYPVLNFESLDKALQIAYNNGISMRAHTLIWHSQTHQAFFKTGYLENGSFVSSDVMDQRIIYYVTNVMRHVYDSPYGSVVYTWDVVNEYFHQLDGSTTNWSEIYNITSDKKLTTTPEYVKLAYSTAYDVLKSYNLEGKISLIYNDYNMCQVTDESIELLKYLNKTDKLNPTGATICDGVGLQSHLYLRWPSVQEQLSTVRSFANAGLEIQITELDICNDSDSYTLEDQADYWYTLVKGLIDIKREGADITGITLWGLYDAVSWRKSDLPLLYGSGLNDPKKSLYAVYAAAQAK